MRHWVKADVEESAEVDGQLQAGAGKKELDPPVLELSFSFPSPSPSCCFSRDVCGICKTQWGQRDMGEVRQWLMAW